jgi:hypothetical protein
VEADGLSPGLETVEAQPQLGEAETQERLLALLDRWRGRSAAEQGYGPGNVVNLPRLLRGHLRGLDLSGLVIRQAYLADVDSHEASLARSHLVESVLAETFDFPTSVALSADGHIVAARGSPQPSGGRSPHRPGLGEWPCPPTLDCWPADARMAACGSGRSVTASRWSRSMLVPARYVAWRSRPTVGW